ncbi:MAG: DUF192 domain-containing protein [Formosimonas sp.]
MNKFILSVSAVLLAACQNHVAAAPLQFINGLEKAKIELAQTNDEHMTGLMHRTQLPADNGMLFVFPNNSQACFWMKDTLVPLTVGFIDETGVLLQTQDMQAQTTDVHCPKAPFRYALEMNQGWFIKHNIPIGTQILIP